MRTQRPERPGAARASERPRSNTRQPIERLYGRNAVRESLRAGRRRYVRLLVSETVEGNARLVEIEALAAASNVNVQRVERSVLDSVVTGHHQGVVLETASYPYVNDYDLNQLSRERAVLLALDGLVDPQNVGTLLRSAEATGVRLVVFPTDRSAQITPAVVNASAGAVEHLRVTTETNLSRWLDRARKAGFWVVGMAGEDGSEPLFDTSMRPPIVLVVGSEGAGLRRLVREHCDVIVSLPMLGKVESLNASVAGSIGLFEIIRDSTDSLIE